MTKSTDICTNNFEFSNLCHPFSIFLLNVLEYYRISLGQLHPQGLARVLHFEVLCRASGYDPTLLLFRRFFLLSKNGDWFTFETSKVDTCLVSSMRHPDAVLNEPESSDSELNSCFLKAIRECPSRLRPFPKHLLVLLGISKLWDKPDRDPVLMRSGHVMSALDFAAAGDDGVVRGSEHRFEDTEYVSVPNVKGFTKTVAPKTLTRRSARRMLKSSPQSTSSDHVDLSDDIEVSGDQGPSVDAEKEKSLFVLGKKKSAGKKATMTPIQGSSRKDVEGLSEDEIYVPNWGVKGMQEYEELSKKKEKRKASMVAMKKDIDISKKEEAWVKKVGEMTRRHEIEIGDLKKKMEEDKLQLKADREALDVQIKAFSEEKEGLKASVVQATGDNKWLIEQGFQQVVTIPLSLILPLGMYIQSC
ncbi:hypothetical protein Hdeb2414_s0009g00321351 [Helianthus debilis subsp. tardiflorus]